jgi:hypothetical protein
MFCVERTLNFSVYYGLDECKYLLFLMYFCSGAYLQKMSLNINYISTTIPQQTSSRFLTRIRNVASPNLGPDIEYPN